MPFVGFCLAALIFILSSSIVFAQDKTPKIDDLDALLSSDKPAKEEEKIPFIKLSNRRNGTGTQQDIISQSTMNIRIRGRETIQNSGRPTRSYQWIPGWS